MKDRVLDGLRVAALVDDDFEQIELVEPMKALREAGATVEIVSPERGQIHGVRHDMKGDAFPVDVQLDDADPASFDALLLPGGALNADKLRVIPRAKDFVVEFDEADKPIAVICHGSWLLVSAHLVNGRTLTSYAAIKDDVRNAGGHWVNREVVRDRNWVTSRMPSDIPAFNRAMIELFAEHLARMRHRRVA